METEMNKLLITLIATAFAGSVMAADEPEGTTSQAASAEKPASAPATPDTDEEKPAEPAAPPATAAE
jgi:hypothetical protein